MDEHQILIIEDNKDDEVLLMRQLKKARLERHVRVMHDGAKALEILADERFRAEDLAAIFLDLKLPKVGGLTILEKIRSNNRTKHIPVIVMTSSNAPEDLQKCRELGISSFVQKPLSFSSFAKAFADTFHASGASAPTSTQSVQWVE